MTAQILIGTSGFKYDDWKGVFYPPDISSRQWLNFYAQEFNTCELNFSYYRVPNATTLRQMQRKVPENFVFTLKANKGMTHDRADNAEVFKQFRASLEPFIERDQLGCVLAQFPYSFHATDENRAYLRRFRERMGDLPTVVEFRNARWITDDTFELLKENDFGFCCVDEPRLKGLLSSTVWATSAKVAYVRFHGRNAAKWWEHDAAWERYDYTYAVEELQEWQPHVEKLAEQAERVFVYANNHPHGQGVDTARKMKKLLGQPDTRARVSAQMKLGLE